MTDRGTALRVHADGPPLLVGALRARAGVLKPAGLQPCMTASSWAGPSVYRLRVTLALEGTSPHSEPARVDRPAQWIQMARSCTCDAQCYRTSITLGRLGGFSHTVGNAPSASSPASTLLDGNCAICFSSPHSGVRTRPHAREAAGTREGERGERPNCPCTSATQSTEINCT